MEQTDLNLQIEEHVKMSMEEYMKKHDEDRAEMISRAIATLKIAAHTVDRPIYPYEG